MFVSSDGCCGGGGGGERSSVKRSAMCFWKSSRSSCSCSVLTSVNWLRRILIRPRKDPWLSCAGLMIIESIRSLGRFWKLSIYIRIVKEICGPKVK